jgi:hypothetical protein
MLLIFKTNSLQFGPWSSPDIFFFFFSFSILKKKESTHKRVARDQTSRWTTTQLRNLFLTENDYYHITTYLIKLLEH